VACGENIIILSFQIAQAPIKKISMKKRLTELLFGKEDFVMDIGVLISLNTKGKPAGN
jgi:hypothetical protein